MNSILMSTESWLVQRKRMATVAIVLYVASLPFIAYRLSTLHARRADHFSNPVRTVKAAQSPSESLPKVFESSNKFQSAT